MCHLFDPLECSFIFLFDVNCYFLPVVVHGLFLQSKKRMRSFFIGGLGSRRDAKHLSEFACYSVRAYHLIFFSFIYVSVLAF